MKKSSKYGVPVVAKFIKEDWAQEINDALTKIGPAGDSKAFDIFDFPLSLVRIELMDMSFVEFRYAYPIVSKEKMAILLLTEHCGYHVFPIHEAKIFIDGKLFYKDPLCD